MLVVCGQSNCIKQLSLSRQDSSAVMLGVVTIQSFMPEEALDQLQLCVGNVVVPLWGFIDSGARIVCWTRGYRNKLVVCCSLFHHSNCSGRYNHGGKQSFKLLKNILYPPQVWLWWHCVYWVNFFGQIVVKSVCLRPNCSRVDIYVKIGSGSYCSRVLHAKKQKKQTIWQRVWWEQEPFNWASVIVSRWVALPWWERGWQSGADVNRKTVHEVCRITVTHVWQTRATPSSAIIICSM